MKLHLILGSLVLCLACGCVHHSSSTDDQQSTISTDVQNAEKAAKAGAHVVVAKVAGTPVKVISAVSGAAHAVKNKVEGEDDDDYDQN